MKLRHRPAKTSTSAKTARAPFEGQPEKVLPIAEIIDSYNHHMNGVDISVQLRAGFQLETRVQRADKQALMYLFLMRTKLYYPQVLSLGMC
jgi:hypothetical protein